jgi:hypothetical protein
MNVHLFSINQMLGELAIKVCTRQNKKMREERNYACFMGTWLHIMKQAGTIK